MRSRAHSNPIIMSFGHTDPTGGSGIQADIETIASLSGYCAPIITAAIPFSTSRTVKPCHAPPECIQEQAEAVLADMPVSAIKVGYAGDRKTVEVITNIVAQHPDIPLVLNPHVITSPESLDVFRYLLEQLGPYSNIICIASHLAKKLYPRCQNLDELGRRFAALECPHTLITGTHESTPLITNSLYSSGLLTECYSWERLQHHFHGAGDTMTAAIAAILAHDTETIFAVQEAQDYTWECLTHTQDLGCGMSLPNRLYWARGSERQTTARVN